MGVSDLNLDVRAILSFFICLLPGFCGADIFCFNLSIFHKQKVDTEVNTGYSLVKILIHHLNQTHISVSPFSDNKRRL